MHNIESSQRRNSVVFGVAALLSLLVLANGLQAQRAAKAPTAFGDDYAGSTTCQICHEDKFSNVTKSNPHRVVETDTKLGFAGHVCESCHGPGAKHAKTGDIALIRFPSHLSIAETDKMCLNCHSNQQSHVGTIQNTHSKYGVACTSCHKMHVDGG